MAPFLIFAGMLFLILIIRVFAGSMDSDRIDEYIRSKGGELIEKHWAPFGKGWFGSEHQRLYEVRYYDSEGNEHKATCKTSMLGGVYFTEDNIVRYTDSSDRSQEPESSDELVDSLIDENQRLKGELERLKDR